MNDEQADPIETLFHTARELNPEERLRFLDEKCGGDTPLRRTLETLLREDATPLGPLDVGITESFATTLSPGMVIGPYEVVSIAGIGGMGQVYRAVDRRLKRDVAIKALPAEFTHDRERMKRLRDEAMVLASLNHANIAGIYDVLEKGDEPPCLVLEFVPGATLAELLGGGRFDVDRTLRIAHQIATALEAAHSKGIVHRDLKPSNIKLTPDAKVKVLDFGLARTFGDGSAGIPSSPAHLVAHAAGISGLAGTPSYMSPEQAQGRRVDQRADIWSFGCIVYELLTGQKAFGGIAARETLESVLHSEPGWTLLPPDIPSELRLLLGQCLQKDLVKRLHDSSLLRRALERLEKNQNAPVPLPVSTASAVPRGPRRRTMRKAAAVLLLVLAVATGGTVWWSRPLPPAPRLSHVAEANQYFEMSMEAFKNAQLERGRELIREALRLDPKFAVAREIYGFSLWLEIDQGYSNNRDLLYDAEIELKQALKDGESPNAHAYLALVYYYLERKPLMLEHARRSLELDASNRDARMAMAIYHQLDGNYDTAQAILQGLIAENSSDPPGIAARGNFAENLRQMDDYPGAILEYRNLYKQEPRSGLFLAQAYQSQGDLGQSRRLLDEAASANPKNYIFRLLWSLQLALEERREEALREMDEDLLYGAQLVYHTLYVAEFYAVLGETDKALDWLERGIRAGDERVEWFERDPLLKNIRDLTRFKRIVATVRERRVQTAAKP